MRAGRQECRPCPPRHTGRGAAPGTLFPGAGGRSIVADMKVRRTVRAVLFHEGHLLLLRHRVPFLALG